MRSRATRVVARTRPPHDGRDRGASSGSRGERLPRFFRAHARACGARYPPLAMRIILGLVARQAGAPVGSISDPTLPPTRRVGCATRLGCSSRHGCSRPDEAIVSLVSITDEMPARGLGPYGAPRALEMPSSSRMRTPLRGKDDFTLTLRSGEPSRVSGSPMSSRARRTCVAPALRSELGCERAGQPAGRVFVYRSGSLEVCRL